MTPLRHVFRQLAPAAALWLPFAAAAADDPAARFPVTSPATRRAWIEPVAASRTTDQKERTPSPPATLRLPVGFPALPIGASRPDLPAAADFDQRLLAAFTRDIQPLLINRCASGRCHGGPDATAPRLTRRGPGGTVDRELTLANIEAICDTLRSDGDPARLMTSAASPHGGSQELPLTPPQLQRLAAWVDAALAQRTRWSTATAVGFDVAAEPVPAGPTVLSGQPAPAADGNRFRRLIDQAGSPDPLPPPQQPSGIIDFAKFPEAGPAAE